MASTTGIELGPDSCVMVGVRPPRRGVADVMALHVIEPSWWPAHDVALVEMIGGARRSKGFPRTARVVAWGLPDAPAIDDPITHALLRPITAAGFRVASILTPPQALALLAASRPRSAGDGAVAWLALNIHAAAIAIVSRGELLFARTFAWSYRAAAMSAKEQLLQRYSLVAQLAPEMRHAIAAVRASRGITVEGVVTCGDLPELRSLTMPLIEELDLEVETLDSTEGLRAVGKARIERFAESAPAIRLACAAGLARLSGGGPALQPLVRVAAAIGIIAALGWGGYVYWRTPIVRPATVEHANPPNPAAASAGRRGPPSQAAPRGPANAAGKGQVIAQGPPVTTAPGSATPAQGRPPIPAVSVPPAPPRDEPKPVQAAPPKVELKPMPAAPPKVELKPVPSVPPKVEPKPLPSAPLKVEPKPLPSAPPKVEPKPVPSVPPRVEPKLVPAVPAKVEPKPTPPAPAKVEPKPTAPVPANVEPPPGRVDPPVTAKTPSEAISPGIVEPPPSRTPNRRQVPLKDPLPKVDSVLIDQDRRLAIIDGVIVAVGDAVGPRVVVQIDRDFVVLREPSGLSVRIPVRSRMTI